MSDFGLQSGGPTWEVPKGRKDGTISRAIETKTLPAPTFNFTQLKKSFSQRGLSTSDLVALSGGHTLGFAHCSSFQNRIHKVDHSINSGFASRLRKVCPMHNKVHNAGATLDSTAVTFDNAYYKMMLEGKVLFSSDQSLMTDRKSRRLVSKFAQSEEEFNTAFVNSMIKMGSIAGGGHDVRLDCKVVR